MSTWQEQAATCAVGDPDPSVELEDPLCWARHNGRWCCLLPAGHTTQHVAGDGRTVCHVWPVTT